MIERIPWRRRFFTIWIGQQLSVVGSRAAQFALVWWVTDTTGSATVLATAAMVALVPQILLGPFVGALIDRWNRRTVMAVSDAFIALLSLGLALLFWSGRIALWHVYAIMLLRSIGETFHWPAMAASTTLMVPKRHLARIGGLNQTVLGILSILAPPLGALLMALLPLHAVMLVDVGTAAFAVIPLLILTIPQPAREHVDAVRRTPFLASAREGLRFVFSWPGLVVLIASASIVKIALQPAFSLLPLLVRNHFGGGAAELSLFQAIAGGGILLGGLILGVWGGVQAADHHDPDGGRRRRSLDDDPRVHASELVLAGSVEHLRRRGDDLDDRRSAHGHPAGDGPRADPGARLRAPREPLLAHDTARPRARRAGQRSRRRHVLVPTERDPLRGHDGSLCLHSGTHSHRGSEARGQRRDGSGLVPDASGEPSLSSAAD